MDLNKQPTNNIEWAAQQIHAAFDKKELKQLEQLISKLDETLYKSWAKDLTLSDLHRAVKMAAD